MKLGIGLSVSQSLVTMAWRIFRLHMDEIAKLKVKLTLCFNRAPRHEGTRWKLVVRFTPPLLYPQRKSTGYLLSRRLVGPQSRFGRGGEEKNSQHIQRLEPSIIQPVAQRYIAELTCLLHSCECVKYMLTADKV
jgi:hypothetical protein